MTPMTRTPQDAASFAAVFDAHHREVVRLAYLLASDPGEAEDVAADAFARVYPRWRRGRVREPGPDLRRAVAEVASSGPRRRRVGRRRRRPRCGDDRGVRVADARAPEHDPVWRAVRALPTPERHAVVLRYFADLTVEESAATLASSEQSVRSAAARGLQQLQHLLDEESTGRPVQRGDDGQPGGPPARTAQGGEA